MSNTTSIYEEVPDMDTIGGRLSRARDAAGFTVKDLAWRLGVKVSTISGWESDRAQPGAHRLTVLAGLLNVSLSWLLHGIGTAPNESEPTENVGTVSAQLDRLRLLHMETGQLITRMQADLDRLAAVRA